MANITIGPGGGTVVDGVVVYLPSCSAISYSDISWSGAEAYDITSTEYLEKLVPTVLPGIILGIICLLGFIFFSLWTCVQCCNRRKLKVPRDPSEHAQFIASTQQQSAVYRAGKPALRKRRWLQPGFLFTALLLATAAAVVGVSTWGLVESIDATNNTVTNFWGIVDDIAARVDNATRGFQDLERDLLPLSGNLSVLTVNAQGLLDAVKSSSLNSNQQVSQTLDQAQTLLDTLDAVPQAVSQILATVKDAINMLRDNFRDTITDITDSYEDPTMAIEETWRFIPIAVCFGLTIFVSLLCAAAFWRLRWYRTATAALWLLWLTIALLMLLGVGLLKGLYVVSSDSCKYVEFLSYKLAGRKISGDQREQVLTALGYYFGVVGIEDRYVVSNITGVPTFQLHEFVEGPVLNYTNQIFDQLAILSGQLGTVAPGVNATTFARNLTDGLAAARTITEGLPGVSDTLLRLEWQALNASVVPLYHRVKEYICCDLSRNAHEVWVAWTVAGVLGFLLAVLCSGALIFDMLAMRRQRRSIAAAVAATASWPGDEAGTSPPVPAAPAKLLS
ncbi:epidermal growth factor receptor [Chlorella sorokiniana]|uniref:Epidermal growth factor receptor n=1 Tax=Chlorella sorokiniana TaxID=3076 RepID=A0A2P6TC63_CHLSO|nr:epidermal growth factor receptor [Chlorella sorokiniana]|eukprot:PRW20192.1 epidermal growth factor receptor [Chlorella sorokiniana]